jgi:hypothetical protein
MTTTSAAKQRSCFVISPIGEPGSLVRRHADAVYKYIIQPAAEECGMVAHRSDHLSNPGSISNEMHRRILNDDLCIVLLTGRNPNVYYELAVALSARRPVIMLLERGEEAPFDIQDLRLINYDLLPDLFIEEKAYARQLVQYIKAFEDAGWRVECPIQGMEAAWQSAPSLEFYAKSSSFGSHERWMGLLHATSKKFYVMGISLRTWQEGENLANVLLDKASKGCDVRILLTHPENPALPQLINEGRPDEQVENIKHDIEYMSRYVARLIEKENRIGLRCALIGCPLSQLTLTDSSAVFIPYMFSARSSGCPLWRAVSGTSLYDGLTQEFDALWAANADNHP